VLALDVQSRRIEEFLLGAPADHRAAGAFDDHAVALAFLMDDNDRGGTLSYRCGGAVGLSAQSARVHLCGPMRIELDGERVEQALPGRQGRLLFAYLLLERDRGVSRDELPALLWPERPPPSAGVTLRALLSKLRAALGTEAVSGTSELRIDLGDSTWVDAEAAVSAVQRSDRAAAIGSLREAWSAAQVALSIASRRFLPGDDGEWIADKRR
jgi:hypothetical protein